MSVTGQSNPEPKPNRSEERADASTSAHADPGFWQRLGNGLSRTAHSLGDLLSRPLPGALRGLSERSVAQAGDARSPRLASSDEPKKKLTIEKFLAGLLPSGLKVDADHHLHGELTLYRTSPNCRVWSSGIQPALEQAAQKLLSESVRMSSAGGHVMELAYHSDVELTRLRLRFPSGFSSSRQPFGKIIAEMRDFAGSDAAVLVLSAVLRSQLLTPLEYLETAAGDPLTFAAPIPSMEGDSEPIANYRFIDRQGVTHDLGRKPGRHSAATFALDRSQEGDIRISLDWPLFISGFRTVGETNLAPLGGNDYLMKLHYRSQWQLNQAAADQGRLQLSILQPVTVAFEGLLRE